MLAILLVFCTAIAHSQDLVILGDSLSDGGTSGTGYSAFVKLVLQTNDVSWPMHARLCATEIHTLVDTGSRSHLGKGHESLC